MKKRNYYSILLCLCLLLSFTGCDVMHVAMFDNSHNSTNERTRKTELWSGTSINNFTIPEGESTEISFYVNNESGSLTFIILNSEKEELYTFTAEEIGTSEGTFTAPETGTYTLKEKASKFNGDYTIHWGNKEETTTNEANKQMGEEEDTTLQLLEVMDADENLTCQITDNKTIEEITLNEEIENWEDVESIPENATKCNVFISYALITDPIFQSAEGPKISVGQDTLYLSGNDYYIESETNDSLGDVWISKITNKAGLYLQELGKKQSQLQDKESIFLSWGIQEEELSQAFLLHEINEYSEEAKQTNDYLKYPYQDVEKFDYAGVKAASKNQKIEILKHEKVVYSSSDLNDIVDFLNQVDMQHWEKVAALPADSSSIATLRKYAQPKKQSSSELIEIESWEVYQSNTNYYLIEHTIDNETDEYFAIPSNVGDWFLEFVKE